MKTLSFDDFSKLQKIPCSSLLVRVQKAMKDEKGKPITIDKLDLTDAADKGYLITPPKYSEGKYNTMYVSVTSAENTIFEAKVRRFNPMLRVLLENVYAPNNKGNSTPTDNELVEYWKTKVLGKQPLKLADLGKYEYFDLRFFSEYIPNLGFSASLEFILNTPQKSFFYALMSLYPPGIMYKKDRDDNVPSTDSTVKAVFRMNYNTPQKAITYYDKEQQFYMTRPQSSSMIVIEVIEVKLKGKEIQKTETLGYSFMPIFQYVDVDGDSSSIELFVNSSIIQLPLIEGEPDATLLDKCYENGLTAAKFTALLENKEFKLIPKASVVIKLQDNQLEQSKGSINLENDFAKMRTDYITTKDAKSYAFNYAKDFQNNRSAPMMIKLFDKGVEPQDYETSVYDYIQKRYS